MAHRYIYAKKYGEIEKGKILMHSCDNPPCVNPYHLSVGTDRDNKDDMIRKGRQARGERSGFAKFTDKQVVEMRELFSQGIYKYKYFADKHNVTIITIRRIIKKYTWKHL